MPAQVTRARHSGARSAAATVAALALALGLLAANGIRGAAETVLAGPGAGSGPDTSAEPLERDETYCGDRTRADLVAEAGRYSGSDGPEVERAWVMSPEGLAALDPELAEARGSDAGGPGTEEQEVFVIPVADDDADPLDPPVPTVAADERRGQTAAVVFGCGGSPAARVFPPGHFGWGEPARFLDEDHWFSDWTGPDGRPATHDVIGKHRFGPDHHCWWQGVVVLHFEGRQYVHDPEDVFSPERFTTTLDLDTELPADAVDTGYRKDDLALWLSAADAPDAAYLVWPDHTERWPAAVEPIACA